MTPQEIKKPEFPKPRLIREGFMPEQDTMENYRIKKITKGNGRIEYYAQKKILGFWWKNLHRYVYWKKEWANEAIIEHIQLVKGDIVEYLEPDLSKDTKPESNPPPKNP